MELGHYPLQMVASVALIVAAAIVALICDSLKRSNDQLRELAIELKVRRDEEQKRLQLPTPLPAERVVSKTEKTAAPAAPAATKTDATKAVGAATGKERKRTVNSEALDAMERGAALAGSGKRPRSAAPAPVAESKPEPQKPRTIKKDWGTLLNRNAHGRVETKPAAAVDKDLLAAVVDATHDSTTAPGDLSLPAGFQDGYVLNKLVQSRQPVTGLVVSIGVNSTRKSDGKLPAQVHELMQSLIGPHDFAAQSRDDEFMLIFPQERGASAQRRLSLIAQQLWDFQLRSLGWYHILFSWGGVEVRSESIAEAIASASERMQETKSGRKLLTMASPAPAPETQLRQAV